MNLNIAMIFVQMGPIDSFYSTDQPSHFISFTPLCWVFLSLDVLLSLLLDLKLTDQSQANKINKTFPWTETYVESAAHADQ